MGSENRVAVVMVPFIAHGHLNQLLHLSNLISSSYNIPVHFISTTPNLLQAHSRLHHAVTTTSIHFHHTQTPPFTSPPPDPTNHFPSHLQSSFESTLHLRTPVFDFIRSLSQTTVRVDVSPEFRLFAKLQFPHMNNDVGDLFDSSRVIEGEFLEYLEREEISGEKKILFKMV